MHMHHTAPRTAKPPPTRCGGMTVVWNADAITREYEGKSHYFCGEHCATNFMKAPQVFLESSLCVYLIHDNGLRPNERRPFAYMNQSTNQLAKKNTNSQAPIMAPTIGATTGIQASPQREEPLVRDRQDGAADAA